MEYHQKEKYNQRLIGVMLRTGVLLSMCVVLAGGILYLYKHGTQPVDYSNFKPDTSFGPSLFVTKNLWHFSPATLIPLGILFLVFTPIARVLMAVISFWLEKDYLYVAIGLLVLLVVSLSFAGGFTH